MHRRHFVIITAAATGTLGLSVVWRSRARPSGTDHAAFAPGPFLRIDTDGTVTISIARAEMGQGTRTALAMLVAEELDADWNRVRVEQGDLDARYGEQFAGGSAVVRTSWQPLRQAGATARAMLLAAAANRWGVAPNQCATAHGVVRHPATGRVLPYGDLVDQAAALPVPDRVALKAVKQFRIIGTPRQNRDHADIVTGRIQFGIDQRVPNMLFAVIERAPVFGGAVRSVNDQAARAVPGVREVVVVDADRVPAFGENNPKMANGVAVLADSTWAALQGRRALQVDWDDRGGGSESTAAMRRVAEELSREPDRFSIQRGGSVIAALEASARRIEAVYETPLLAHAQMEPMNCLADVQSGHCEVWAPTQMPEYVRVAAQRITGLAPEAITVHVCRMGGAFGRRFYADYAAEAIYLSRALGRPVQVVWSREDDLRHGFYRPAGYHVLRGGIDCAGRLTAWEHRLWNASRGHYLQWEGFEDSRFNPGELSSDDYPVPMAPAVAAIDAGLVVHPEGARAQVEGAILQGLSAALGEQITVTAGRVEQGNFDSYSVLRHPQAPRIEVHFVPGSDAPGGLGEPALPPAAPALTNAIFAASGKRIRRLPIRG